MYFWSEQGAVHLNAVYNFSCIIIYWRSEDELQLEPKHVAMNKLINTGVVGDLSSYILLHFTPGPFLCSGLLYAVYKVGIFPLAALN